MNHILLLPLLLAVAATAQDPRPTPAPRPKPPADSRPTFPPKSFRVIEPKRGPAAGPGAAATPRVERDAEGRLQVVLRRPQGYGETVVTDAGGQVLARSNAERVTVPKLDIADRFVVYASDPDNSRCQRLLEDFVHFPGTIVPGKQWRPRDDAVLQLQDVVQHCPKSRAEARTEPHRITFRSAAGATAKEPGPVLYVLARVAAGGKDMVGAQSTSGELLFWFRAKAGETFRIYELHPKDRTYRVTDMLAVAHDAPRGR